MTRNLYHVIVVENAGTTHQLARVVSGKEPFRMFSFLFALLGSAQAAPVTPQVSINVSGSHELSERVDLRGQAISLSSPGNGMELYFTYVGTRIEMVPGWNLTVQPGAVFNWFGQGDVGAAFAVINTFSIGGFDVFLDTEGYILQGGEPAYFGYYSVTHAAGPLVLGGQVEQVNLGVGLGPQVGIPLGDHLFYSLEYYYGLELQSHTLRNCLIVGF